MKRVLTALSLICAMLVSAFAQEFLNICPDCGREAPAASLACPSCKARLPAADRVKNEPAPEAPEPVAAPVGDPVLDSAQREMTEQGRALLSAQPFQAWYFFQNARAMALLPGAPDPEARRTALIELEKQAKAATQKGEVPCTSCGGSGKRAVLHKQLEGVNVARGKVIGSGLSCADCKGRGRIVRAFKAEELRQHKVLGRRLFDETMRQKGFKAVGRGYLPESLETGLKPAERVRFMQAFEQRCEVCTGLGFSDCAACRGAGRIPCTNRACTGGEVKKKVNKNGRSIEQIETCPTCAGKIFLLCSKCRETGRISCRTCAGSGLAKVCARCKGEGLSACSVCRGTGADRSGGVCAKCEGEREMLCTTCAGEGRQVR